MPAEQLSGAFREGMDSLDLSFRLPEPGRYRLVLHESALDGGPARLSLERTDRVVLDLVAGPVSETPPARLAAHRH